MFEKITNDVTGRFGATPPPRRHGAPAELHGRVVARVDPFNLMSGVKERIAASMIAVAQAEGCIGADTIVLQPSFGNTGIGLAMVCAARGIKCCFVMPETISRERRMLLRACGAQLVLTPGADGMAGVSARVEQMAAGDARYFVLDRFENPANPAVYRATAARDGRRDRTDVLLGWQTTPVDATRRREE